MMRPVIRGAVFALWSGALVRLPGAAADPPAIGDPPSLTGLVQHYFDEANPETRTELAVKIDRSANGSIPAVLSALGGVAAWAAADAGVVSTIHTKVNDLETSFEVRLPSGYDAARAHPLLIVLAADGESVERDPWYLALREREEGIVVIVPRPSPAPRFHASGRGAEELRAWLSATRRRYHVEGNRVYLYGAPGGADTALMLVLMQPDAFAGAIIREAVFDGPYGRELLPLLLPNLRNTPVHLIWTEPPMPAGELLSGREFEVALTALLIRETADRLQLPVTETVLAAGREADYSSIGPIFTRRRAQPSEFTKQFRFPTQGQAYFVRVIESLPDTAGGTRWPWVGDQIHILTAGHTDASAYVTSVLDSKLPKIIVKIEGQSIDVRTSLCDAFNLNLPADALDFDKPVTIQHNGIRVFEGRLKPDVKTLLDSAYTDWEFQRPTVVRLRITARGTVTPY